MEHSKRSKYIEQAHLLKLQGHDLTYIEAILIKEGCEKVYLAEIWEEVKQLKSSRRTQNGSILVVVGAILLVIGFVSCLFLHYAGGSLLWALYGITLAGLTVLFFGIYKIFQ